VPRQGASLLWSNGLCNRVFRTLDEDTALSGRSYLVVYSGNGHVGLRRCPVSAFGTYPRFQCKLLDVVVLMFSVMMAVAGAKEPQIAGRAAIRVLKQHMVKEPIFEAASSRSKELFAAAIGTTRDLSLRSGFVHGKTLYWGPLFYA